MSDNENNNESEATLEESIVVTKKDPRKVEQGKRLAAISKEAKERKMRARIEAELRQGASFTDFLPLSYKFYGSVVVVTSVFFLGTWWLMKGDKKEEKVVVPPRIEKKESENKESKFAEL